MTIQDLDPEQPLAGRIESGVGSTPADEPSVAEAPTARQRRGFAAMDPARQREIAALGGRMSHKKGRGHEWNQAAAREAGRKGGLASRGGRGKLPGDEGAR